jgi:catechol 2,3-dioxygenase-like lactoylglutathione lyase family enzyme
MPNTSKARAVGLNHIALEVGDIEEALAFYRRLFEFTLRGKSEDATFIDLGDQFLALQKGRKQPGDDGRHFGLVVDDKEAVRASLTAASVEILPASHPTLHLVCCPARERQEKNTIGIGAVDDQIPNAVRQRVRLAATRSGNDEHGFRDVGTSADDAVLDRLSLVSVELVQIPMISHRWAPRNEALPDVIRPCAKVTCVNFVRRYGIETGAALGLF